MNSKLSNDTISDIENEIKDSTKVSVCICIEKKMSYY